MFLIQENGLPDKLCTDCFNQFSSVADFYQKCKNSRSNYTPCFRDTSQSQELDASTFRILSTVTPDAVTSKDSNISRPISSELLSSSSRSVPSQTISHGEAQSKRPEVKKVYKIHYDLGIKLPRPIVKHKGCFDPDDYCYEMLLDEFEDENVRQLVKKSIVKSCTNNYPPITSLLEKSAPAQKGYSHIADCPFCTAVIPTERSSLNY